MDRQGMEEESQVPQGLSGWFARCADVGGSAIHDLSIYLHTPTVLPFR